MVKGNGAGTQSQKDIDRVIGKISGKAEDPYLIFIGGIHGNEPSGVLALQQVFRELEDQNIPLKGNVLGLAGNLWALQRSQRFHEEDLNRLWSAEAVDAMESGSFVPKNEDQKEQAALYWEIRKALDTGKGPFYFFDLHTTSSQTKPFLTVNDSLLNRKFTRQYPLPQILGIEEYLDGPILSYINELGYVSFGFEGGQHDSTASRMHHVAFIYVSMVFAGILEESAIDFPKYYSLLGSLTEEFYEIYYRERIGKEDNFAMKPGFENFQVIQRGEILAEKNGLAIKAPEKTRIFMPLYQKQGEDGFFLIRRIPMFFLRLSAFLRKLKVDRVLPFLPGVRKVQGRQDTLEVNLNIAKLFTRPFLHLLGYRSKVMDKSKLIIRNRESRSRDRDYQNTKWYST